MPSVAAMRHPTAQPQPPWSGRPGGLEAVRTASERAAYPKRAIRARRTALGGHGPYREIRNAIRDHRELAINVQNVSKALVILSQPEAQYLNKFEYLLRVALTDSKYASLNDDEYRQHIAYRVLGEKYGHPRMFAERLLGFGCDTKYASYTFCGGCGVPTYGPVCLVFAEDRLPQALRDQMTCFVGDSARVAASDVSKEDPNNIPELLYERYCLARYVPILASHFHYPALSQLRGALPYALAHLFALDENMIEVHLHGDVPLSALAAIRIKRSAVEKARAIDDAWRRDRTASLDNRPPEYRSLRILHKLVAQRFRGVNIQMVE